MRLAFKMLSYNIAKPSDFYTKDDRGPEQAATRRATLKETHWLCVNTTYCDIRDQPPQATSPELDVDSPAETCNMGRTQPGTRRRQT